MDHPSLNRREFIGSAAAIASGLGGVPSGTGAPPSTVVLDVQGMPWDELCTAESLQGLANRGGPRVYLDHGEPADRKWLEIYAERAGLRYEPAPSLRDLVARCRRSFSGVVIYDPDMDGSRYAAITAAGVLRALPVCPKLLADLGNLGPIRLDLRGRFTRSVDAYDWALDNLMPRCSRRLAHSVDGGRVDGVLTGVCGPMSGFDWQVMNRGFVFNLGAQATRMVSYGGEVGGDADQAAMYDRILGALQAPAQVNGYGDPEDYWCLLLSRHGHYSFHAFHNWSFHSKVPVRPGAMKQRVTFMPASVQPDTQRVSVCFMTSEGDTMKGPLPFFYGSWFDPGRGSVAVNWGVNPLMARLFPAMLEYYYATATPNDGFFAGPSGAGYCYPDVMPDPGSFGRHTGQAARQAGIECLDLWGGAIPAVQARYSRAAHPLGITTMTSPARIRLLPDGTPVINHELGYWQTDGLDGANWTTVFADEGKRATAVARLAGRIERIASRVRPPFVILVLGDLHSYGKHASLYAEVARSLDSSRFRVVRLDQATCELRAWASERVLVGGESINEAPAWAVLKGARTHLTLTLTNGRGAATPVTVSSPEQDVPLVRVTLKARERREVVVRTVEPTEALPGPALLGVDAAGHGERLDIDVASVKVGGSHGEVTLARVWGSDLMVHPTGTPITDPDALRRAAWLSTGSSGKYECVVCGPYSDLPAGRYLAAFRIRPAGPRHPARADGKVATLDIAAGGYGARGGVRASTTVSAADLDPNGGWTWHSMEFDWLGTPDLMEARAWTHGKEPFAVDRIVVFRLGRR